MYKTNDENQITPSLPRNAGWNVWTLLIQIYSKFNKSLCTQFLNHQIRKHGYKTLGAREINSPMFPPSLSANNNIDSTQSCAECSVTNIKSKTYHLEYFSEKHFINP